MAIKPPFPRFRLDHPAQPDDAIQMLNERITALRNLPAQAGGSTNQQTTNERWRDHYLMWVEDTEVHFANYNHDPAVLELLHTRRYWAIRDVDPISTARPIPLVRSEIEWQTTTLHRLRTDLELRVQRARSGPGHITVIDSNSLLHFMLPDQIDWQEVVGTSPVRLVIPLRVIEELDAKKYSDSKRNRERARQLLPKLEEMVGLWGDPSPAVLGKLTMEVLIEAGVSREKPEDADEEILDTCRELWDFSHQDGGVTLITGDTGMTLRAHGLGGIRPLALPDKYLRDRD